MVWCLKILLINLFHPVALGLDREIGNFEVGKEFDALLINPKASDSPIDLFCGDFVGDISDVSKRKLIEWHFISWNSHCIFPVEKN